MIFISHLFDDKKPFINTQNILARFIAKPTLLRLAAAEYVAFESSRFPETSRLRKGCFDERPAAASPVAVAAVDKLVRAASEAAFGGVLAGRKPRDQSVEVEVAKQVSLLCFSIQGWKGNHRFSGVGRLNSMERIAASGNNESTF